MWNGPGKMELFLGYSSSFCDNNSSFISCTFPRSALLAPLAAILLIHFNCTNFYIILVICYACITFIEIYVFKSINFFAIFN